MTYSEVNNLLKDGNMITTLGGGVFLIQDSFCFPGHSAEDPGHSTSMYDDELDYIYDKENGNGTANSIRTVYKMVKGEGWVPIWKRNIEEWKEDGCMEYEISVEKTYTSVVHVRANNETEARQAVVKMAEVNDSFEYMETETYVVNSKFV